MVEAERSAVLVTGSNGMVGYCIRQLVSSIL